jgi:hypothetical protein
MKQGDEMNIVNAKNEIIEKFLFNISNCFLNIKEFKRNYIYTGIGNYELISRLTQYDSNNYSVNFRINNRFENHKNLFEWNYLYKNDRKSKEFLNKLLIYNDFLLNGYDKIKKKFEKELNDKNLEKTLVNLEKEIEKKQEKILEETIFEVFKEKYEKFLEILGIILSNEYFSSYSLQELLNGKDNGTLFFNQSLLSEDDNIGNISMVDNYFLNYRTKNGKFDWDNLEILGFSSLFYNRFQYENNEDIKSYLITKEELSDNNFLKYYIGHRFKLFLKKEEI